MVHPPQAVPSGNCVPGPGDPPALPCNSNIIPDACTQDCRKAYCGDGKADPGEVCDDGVGAKRDTVDDHDNCPNGTQTFAQSCDEGITVACGLVPTCGDALPKLFNSANCDANETLLDGNNANGECSDACDNPGNPKDPKNKPKATEECDNGSEVDPGILLCLLVTPGSSADCLDGGGTPGPAIDDCFLDSINRCNKGGLIPGAGADECITDNNCKGADNTCGNSDTTPNACRDSCELPRCGDDVTDTQSEGCDGGDAVCESGASADTICVGGPVAGSKCDTNEVAGDACPAGGCDCGGRCEGGSQHNAFCNKTADCPGGACNAQATCETPCESDDDCDNNPPCLANEADCDNVCRDASSETGENDEGQNCEDDPQAGQFCQGGFNDDAPCQGPGDTDCLCPIGSGVFLPGVCDPGNSINQNNCCTTDKDCGLVCNGGTRDGKVCFNNSDCPDPDQNKAVCKQGTCDTGACVDTSKLPDSEARHCVGAPGTSCEDDDDCELNDVCESVCNNDLPSPRSLSMCSLVTIPPRFAAELSRERVLSIAVSS
jgi:hypothetical protein